MKKLLDKNIFISAFSKLKSNNNSNYSKLSFLLLILFSGCDEASNLVNSDSTTDSTSDGRSIHGIVTDSNDNSRLDSVKVYWTDTNGLEFTYTDTVGYYRIDELTQSTNYDITFEKNNYATMIRNINVLEGGIDDDLIYAATIVSDGEFSTIIEESFSGVTLSVPMYPLIGSVSGKVYKVLDDENTQLASGVVILAYCHESSSDLNDNFYSSSDNDNVISISPNQFVDTTGTDGIYSFNNLPLTSSLVLTALPYNDGTYSFAAQTQTVTLSPNITITADDIKLPVSTQTPFLISNNFENDDFQLNDNITLTFSATMKTDDFEISLKNGSDEVPFTATWSNDLSLTIDPSLTLQANATYTLSLNGRSTSNGTFNEALTFTTQDGIELLSTNSERADGVFDQFSISSDILLEFSMTPELTNAGNTIDLKDASSSKVSADVSLSGTTVTINPAYDLEPDQNYTLTYKVYSSIAGDYDDGTFSFSTASGQISAPAQVASFELADTTIKADYNTTLYNFKWLNVVNANGYRIYAKDNNLNSDFVVVGEFSASSHLTYQNQSINLSSYSQFDVYTSDGSQTPLAGGTQLTFGIVAYNDIGESPVSTLIPVRDEMKPISTITMSGLANNSSGTTSSTFTLTLSANEFLDTDFSYSITETNGIGGDESYVIDSTAASYLWNADMKGGVFVFTVPTGKNASSDTFTIKSLKDNSMNVADSLTFQLCGSGECTNNVLTYDFNDGNVPSGFSVTGNAGWYLTSSEVYEGGFAIRSGNGYFDDEYFEFSTSAIPVGKSVNISFYAKGICSNASYGESSCGYGYFYVNGSTVYVNNGSNWGAQYSNTSFQQFSYSFTTGPSLTNTFKWKYETRYYGYGIVDKIIVSWY